MSIFRDAFGDLVRSLLTWQSRRRLPPLAGNLSLPGLQGPVEIIRDRWGVPHIYAQNSPDLFFAQGVVHAQDRLWQLELNRRTAQGLLSELFGELTLDTDRATRTFGFNRLAEADWASAPDDLRQVMLAYSAGVNAYLDHNQTQLPLEFALLRHQPRPWRPEDSIAFARLMTWQLSHAWYSEIIRAQINARVGPEQAAELEIHPPAENPVTLPGGIDFNRLDPAGNLIAARGPFLERGQGSNAWAVAAGRSASDHAVLCNDMHLGMHIPGVWQQVHLNAPEIHVTGVSLPGTPLVMVGHNAHIAWGMTLAFIDCEDLFVERFDPQNPHRYRFRNEWLEAKVFSEPISVKGRSDPHLEPVIITRHGPIISDVTGYPEQQLALNSMALRPSPALSGWLKLNQARNWDDFVAALRLIEAPQLNVTYADVDGNIGYWLTGRVPQRAKGDGSIPAPGWNGEYEWSGEIPFEEMPHALNPKQGIILSCNHRVVDDDYPHFLGNAWMNGYRARRIEQLFAAKEKLGFDDFRAAQLDVTSLPGLEFVACLAGLPENDSDVALALSTLRTWDGRLDPDSSGGSIYQVARYRVIRNLLEPDLGSELTLRLMGQGFHPILFGAHEFYGHDTVTMLRLLDDPASPWIEAAGGRETLLLRSLKEAVQWLRAELGPDPSTWRWGRLHQITFPHSLALRSPLDQVFSRGPFPIGGDTDTPLQTAILPQLPYANNGWAPSFRQIIDMGNLSGALAIAPPGQSGRLASPHYDDLIEPWLAGEYHPMLWTREQVEQAAVGILTLTGL